MSPKGKPRDLSRPMLDQVQGELNRTLADICTVGDVREESTGQMERLSDSLLDAARRAHVAAELRKSIKKRTLMEHIKRRHRGTDIAGDAGDRDSGFGISGSGLGIRD